MSASDARSLPDLSRNAWRFLETRVKAFEAAWAAGGRPDPAEYLPDDDPTDGQLLVELIHADLEFRLESGEPVAVEAYLKRFPALRTRPDDIEKLTAAAERIRRERAIRESSPQATPPIPSPAGAETLAERAAWPVAVSGAAGVGRFRFERVLGQGGFGVVYLATDPSLGRAVAVKMPHPHILADAALRERFLREAQAAAALEHPNIVPVHEAGEDETACYLVSAYCSGPNVAEWLAVQAEPVEARIAAALVAALADAIDYSHGRGVLHRDLKPANILLTPRPQRDGGTDGELPFVPRLTDFGLAKVVEASLAETRTSIMLGTPLYMAPEQAESLSDIGPAADIYSLGTILYEILAGRVPFEGSLAAVLDQVRNTEPIPPSRLRPGVPRDLEMVCLKCLHKEPGDRYANAGGAGHRPAAVYGGGAGQGLSVESAAAVGPVVPSAGADPRRGRVRGGPQSRSFAMDRHPRLADGARRLEPADRS